MTSTHCMEQNIVLIMALTVVTKASSRVLAQFLITQPTKTQLKLPHGGTN